MFPLFKSPLFRRSPLYIRSSSPHLHLHLHIFIFISTPPPPSSSPSPSPYPERTWTDLNVVRAVRQLKWLEVPVISADVPHVPRPFFNRPQISGPYPNWLFIFLDKSRAYTTNGFKLIEGSGESRVKYVGKYRYVFRVISLVFYQL